MTIINLQLLDISKPPKEVLIDKINAANSLTLDPNDFVLGVPTAIAGNPSYDTSVALMPTASSRWYGEVVVHYKRVRLQEVFAVNLKAETAGTETTLLEILTLLNSTYGIHLTPDDVEPATITYSNPANLHSAGTVLVKAKVASVLFQGEATIQVNTSNVQGPIIYEDNQTYFAVINEAGKHVVKAYNALGALITTFRFLDGAVVNASTIKKLIVWPNNDVMIIGDFNYDHTDSFNVVTNYQHKLVRMNSRGRLNGVSVASRFGVEYNLTYYPDTERGVVYALDPANAIGGNVHGLHRYLEDGTYDNTFAATALNAATSQIKDLTIDADGNVFIVTDSAGDLVVTKLLSTGEVSTDPQVTIGLDLEDAHVADIRASTDGVFVRLTMPVNRTKQNVIQLNGVPMWDEAAVSTDGRWIEIVKIGLDMTVDPAFNSFHNDRASAVLGVADQTDYNVTNSLCPIHGYVSYLALTSSPVSGFERPCTVSLSAATGRHQGITGHYYDDLHWTRIDGTSANATLEVMVWGTYRELTQAGFGATKSAIALYSRLGDMPQTLVIVESGAILDVVAFAEETP